MFQPRNEYVVIRPDELPAQIGSILLPDSHRDHALHNGDGVLHTGTVVAVGPGDLITKGPRKGQYVPIDLQVGDRVAYPKHQLVPTVEDGLHVIHQQHIFGAIEQ